MYNNNPRYINGNSNYMNPGLSQTNNLRPSQNACKLIFKNFILN